MKRLICVALVLFPAMVLAADMDNYQKEQLRLMQEQNRILMERNIIADQQRRQGAVDEIIRKQMEKNEADYNRDYGLTPEKPHR